VLARALNCGFEGLRETMSHFGVTALQFKRGLSGRMCQRLDCGSQKHWTSPASCGSGEAR
jgi:hypothetical protein